MRNFTELMVKGDVRSLLLQLGVLCAWTEILIYSVVLMTRRYTYVRSHGWLLFEAVVASLLALAFYRVNIALNLSLLTAIIVLSFWAIPVNIIIYKLDGGVSISEPQYHRGRALINITPFERKKYFRTDFSLVRRAAIFAVTVFLVFQYRR